MPIVIDDLPADRLHHLLVSGEAGWPNSCPSGASFDHDDALNKDDSVPPGGSAQTSQSHALAARMATHQTRHEWCRLLHLALRENEPAGAAVLMGLLADPRRSPHPPGTLCEASSPGPVRVTVAVTKIAILSDKEDDAAGQQNFVFSVFTEDMKRSMARQVGEIRVESGKARSCGKSSPTDLTLSQRH